MGFQSAPDYVFDKGAAYKLAKKIEEFWHANGHSKVRCWVESDVAPPKMSRREFFEVKSNLKNGLPA